MPIHEDDQKRTYRRTEQGVEASRTFTVDAPTTVAALAALAGGSYGVQYGSPWRDLDGTTPNGDLICRQIDPKLVRQPGAGTDGYWELTANYSTIRSGSPSSGGGPGMSTVWLWNIGVEAKPIRQDVNGTFIRNSKGMFIPDLSAQFPNVTLTVKKWASSYNVPTMIMYTGAINSTTWIGATRHQALCTGIMPEPSEPGWIIQYHFAFTATWDISPEDRDEDGYPLRDGQWVPIGVAGNILGPFQIQREMDFNNLGL